MKVRLAPATSAAATDRAVVAVAAGVHRFRGAPLSVAAPARTRCRCRPSTASRRAKPTAPAAKVHHGSISLARDAGMANTDNNSRPAAAGARNPTASRSAATATTPMLSMSRHRMGAVASTGGTPTLTCSSDSPSSPSTSRTASGPGSRPRTPLPVNSTVTRHDRTSSWPVTTIHAGSRIARSATPAAATVNTASATRRIGPAPSTMPVTALAAPSIASPHRTAFAACRPRSVRPASTPTITRLLRARPPGRSAWPAGPPLPARTTATTPRPSPHREAG